MMGDKFFLTLDVSEGQFANLVTIAVLAKGLPFYALELHEEVDDIDWMNKVQEGVAYIALGLNRKKTDELVMSVLTLRSIGR